jgi:V/A-type H+-transporting ATPase subunit A
MMKVVGEEGTSQDDFMLYLKSEYLDATYLQQDAFDPIDGATPAERQQHVFGIMIGFLQVNLAFKDKTTARSFFHQLTQTTRDWNRTDMGSQEFKDTQERLENMVSEVTVNA